MEQKSHDYIKFSEGTGEEPFLFNSNLSDTHKKELQEELVKCLHFDLVRTFCDGLTISEASRRTEIPFSTLHGELKFWEFAGLIKLVEGIQNGVAVKRICVIPLKQENLGEKIPQGEVKNG